ncbi:cytochrome P450 [Ralstonia syzygii subsp. celebesensis]|uniref:RhiH cytochrome P450 monooxygenase, rhizoxin biosynthesis n=2 Tax=Ralstonia syzygii TaxID=28097 RepID=G2ZRP0_9RALS|nr:cytochrome P450 [Ralstonia syzygii subsp. celebesensis]CCA81723.1 RhiH cytochrome P450 monooxygenase, rhizoxin biosynthesis [blood disease bacterium R229]
MGDMQDTAAVAERDTVAGQQRNRATVDPLEVARDGKPASVARPVAGNLAMKDGFPVMPGKVPLLGHVHRISQDALGELRKAEAACGPMFWTYFGARLPVLQILDEEGLAILQNKYTDNSFLREQMPVITGAAMNAFDGPRHRNARHASSAAFSPTGLTRAQVGQFVVESIEQRLKRWTRESKLAIFPKTKDIALEVVFRILGIKTHELAQWRRQYEEFFLGMIPLKINLPGFPAWRCRKARGWLEARVAQIVATARADDDHDSLVGAMIFGRDDNGNGMSEVELVHNILGLGFAGSETTASVMAWSALMLAQHPDVWRQLCRQVAGMDSVPSTQEELVRQAPLAEAIFRETMRLYPPAPFEMRKVHTEFEMMGHKIPAGVMVGVSLLHVSRNPERYPDPDSWKPERWLGVDRALTPVETCGFGGGPHACLGRHVAALEITLFITMLARELGPKGIVPRLAGKLPAPAYLPFLRPSNKAFLDMTGR